MSATAIVVAYGVTELDVSYLRPEDQLIVVHNDDRLDTGAVQHPATRHFGSGENIGFGAGVNLALHHVATKRVVLINPDVALTRSAWTIVADAGPLEIATVRLVDERGTPTSVIARYPGPLSHLLTGLRVGRFVPRRVRFAVPDRLLGHWAGEQRDLALAPSVRVPLSTHWISGAVMSIDTNLFRSVGGFDARYFLYFEDVDLCQRLAQKYGCLMAVVCDAEGKHTVSGSRPEGSPAERHRLDSAILYAYRLPGSKGALCRWGLRTRRWIMGGKS